MRRILRGMGMRAQVGMRVRTGVCGLLLGVLAVGGVAFTPHAAVAQVPTQRIVSGKVAAKDGSAVKGAVVYLKDDKTLAVKSFISTEDGGFRFGQLAQNTDYELWAEADGKKSGVKTISSFDTRNDISVNLKIEK